MDIHPHSLAAIIPYYVDVHRGQDIQERYEQLVSNISALKSLVGTVVVVNDGCMLQALEKAEIITHVKNQGQAAAIRTGLTRALKDPRISYIVQCDADYDQRASDAELLLSHFKENDISPADRYLIVGDRYSPHEDIPSYRTCINTLQSLFFKRFGFEIMDAPSGLRAYTRGFAKIFLAQTKAQRFSATLEQVVLAGLTNTTVKSIPLTGSRLRDHYTPANKLVEIIDYALLCHADALCEKGFAAEIAFIQSVRNSFASKTNFVVDLTPIGVDRKIAFTYKPLPQGYSAVWV